MFQGTNNNVTVRYALSDFVDDGNELEVLKSILQGNAMSDEDHHDPERACGFMWRLQTFISTRDVRDVIVAETSYRYVYHVDPTDGADRILCCSTSTDVPFDEEFYKYLVTEYQERLPEVVFFFVDNRKRDW